ncbi:MAG: aldehyde dehydrogenase family protein [Actinomycetota bacterium]
MPDQTFRVTYATMSAENEELQRRFDEAAARVRSELGKDHPIVVNGEERWNDDRYEERSPIDDDVVIGRFVQATAADVADAVAAAKAFETAWDRIGWQERVAMLRRTADLMEERLFDLAALMSYEVGKNRLEALGDVQETAELVRWNCDAMERHDGFRTPMSGLGAAGDYYDILRPHGVWAIISPFNFPFALSGGPSSGALVAGNPVVLKPSNRGALLGWKLYECLRDAGVPAGAFHFLPGRGKVAGDALWRNPDVDGILFTGSYDVGMEIYRHFSSGYPKPAICEMGGKNPAIVTKAADLDVATDGVLRSAFGFGGQKCSACSRVFVQREVYDAFVQQLVAKTEKLVLGDPLERGTFLGPVISPMAVDTYEEAVAEARSRGKVLTGGERVTDGAMGRGYFVRPTVVEVPTDSWIWKKELFVPFVAVAPFDDLDEAIDRANASEYGLTAGLFSKDQAEIDRWLSRIEAGVVYVNRRAGATTGAWPGVQPFGGWKGSGTTGKSGGGPYYVTQFLREQSRTVIAS